MTRLQRIELRLDELLLAGRALQHRLPTDNAVEPWPDFPWLSRSQAVLVGLLAMVLHQETK